MIECKYYKNNVSLIQVRNLHGLLIGISNSSEILVTTKGCQSRSDQHANYSDFGLKSTRELEDTHWNGCI
ncbi:hypothetical protein [Photobacterium sp. GB-50]|uniref:hypothetical protein n=1 Tax=Photobacterium sp. GB-50 TaxID=2022107 RepID=UPI00351153CC